MNILDEIIESAERLCQTLDFAASNEKKFCDDICLEFERHSFETYKIWSHLKEIKEVCGG